MFFFSNPETLQAPDIWDTSESERAALQEQAGPSLLWLRGDDVIDNVIRSVNDYVIIGNCIKKSGTEEIILDLKVEALEFKSTDYPRLKPSVSI